MKDKCHSQKAMYYKGKRKSSLELSFPLRLGVTAFIFDPRLSSKIPERNIGSSDNSLFEHDVFKHVKPAKQIFHKKEYSFQLLHFLYSVYCLRTFNFF